MRRRGDSGANHRFCFIYCLLILFLSPGNVLCSDAMPEDEKQSFEWTLLHGDHFQQQKLCVRYWAGDGIPVDYDKAHRLCLEASKACLNDAETVLSLMYEKGFGVKKDWKAALGWLYLVATSDGTEELLATEKRLEAALSKEERAGAYQFACEWQKKYCGVVTLPGCR